MNEGLPLVSVIMPVFNEAAFIDRSLGSVLAQDYPAHMLEIIIADGLSTDGTRQILTRYRETYSNIIILDNPDRISTSALNLATAAARADIIVRVDGHCEIAPDYIRKCVEHLLRDGVEGVGGSVVTVGEGRTGAAIARAMSSPFGVGGANFRILQGRTKFADTIPFPAYTRAVVESTGPYDETYVLNQDEEYNYRIRKMGGRLLLAGDVHSVYYARSTLRALWRQYQGYGFYKAPLLRQYPHQMSVRHFVPAAFVTTLGLGLALAPYSRKVRRLVLAEALAYVAAAGTASVKAAAASDWKNLPVLPAAYATMHVSYGVGFVAGLGKMLGGFKRGVE